MPRKPEYDEARTKVVRAKLTPSDFGRLRRMAREAKTTVSTLVCRAVRAFLGDDSA